MTRPGLARERTAAAWGRTALGAAGFGAALLRLGAWSGSILEFAAAGIAAVCAVQLSAAGRGTSPRHLPRVVVLRLVTAEVVTLGVLVTLTAIT